MIGVIIAKRCTQRRQEHILELVDECWPTVRSKFTEKVRDLAISGLEFFLEAWQGRECCIGLGILKALDKRLVKNNLASAYRYR